MKDRKKLMTAANVLKSMTSCSQSEAMKTVWTAAKKNDTGFIFHLVRRKGMFNQKSK